MDDLKQNKLENGETLKGRESKADTNLCLIVNDLNNIHRIQQHIPTSKKRQKKSSIGEREKRKGPHRSLAVPNGIQDSLRRGVNGSGPTGFLVNSKRI